MQVGVTRVSGDGPYEDTELMSTWLYRYKKLLDSLMCHDGHRVFGSELLTLVDTPSSLRVQWKEEFEQFVVDVDAEKICEQLKLECTQFVASREDVAEQNEDVDSDDMPITYINRGK